MAPTFRHGKGMTVVVNAANLSGQLTDIKVSASCQAADVTTFGNNDKKYIPGLTDGTISFGGLFAYSTLLAGSNKSTQIDQLIQSVLGASSKQIWTLGPAGSTLGARAWLVQGDETKYDVDAPVANVVKVAGDVQGSQYASGVWLRGTTFAARSATGVGGAYLAIGSTSVGGTTAGGAGHLHVIAASTITTGVTIKVQHSTSGTTWADLVTFGGLTTADGGRFIRSTVAGTVKEQLRETCSAFTGGAAKSITYVVAFARNGKIV